MNRTEARKEARLRWGSNADALITKWPQGREYCVGYWTSAGWHLEGSSWQSWEQALLAAHRKVMALRLENVIRGVG